jgi:hypothetical protein
MHRLRSSVAIVVAALLLVAGHLSGVSAHAGPLATSGPEPFELPSGIVELFSYHAKGVQTYACTNSQWAFRAPKAALLDPQSNELVGMHYGGIDRGLTAGPWWESLADGSRIRGGNPISAPSPHPNSIPLLRLDVLEHHGSGEFAPVSHVLRLNTKGGVGPSGTCRPGAERWVPYTADYAFYGQP